MGLDSFLSKRTFIGAEYKHKQVKGRIDVKTEGKKIPIRFSRISTIEESIGYWRKANHIHKWFVDNCQDGEDDCRYADVPKEKLIELLEICKQVIKTPSKGKKLLPTTSGFFFGGTEYDEWYISSIEHTIEIIENILKEYEEYPYFDVIYHSSW